MSSFHRKAIEKLEKLSIDEIRTLVKYMASENEVYATVIASMDVGIIVTTTTGRISACNDAARRLLPLAHPMTEGVPLWYSIKDPQLLEFIEQGLQFGPGQKEEREFHFQHGDTIRTIGMEISAFMLESEALLQYDNGKRFLFMISDISEIKRQEARLHRSESLASLTTVAAGVAHEIKNPLASIGIHLQLMRKAFQRRESLTLSDAKRYLDVIDEEIERLNAIVVDFLFAVRPMDVRLRLEQVNKIVDDLCNFVGYELESHHISIVRNLEQFLPKLMVDENLLKQALLNIVKNAMAAMEEHGGVLTIATRFLGDQVAITVTDTGIGMSEHTLSKIFEPYFTTKAAGSGLGLTMVFKVVKEHKGELNVVSKEGEGTTFTILLPVPKSERLALEARE